jgi:hypothetical protein
MCHPKAGVADPLAVVPTWAQIEKLAGTGDCKFYLEPLGNSVVHQAIFRRMRIAGLQTEYREVWLPRQHSVILSCRQCRINKIGFNKLFHKWNENHFCCSQNNRTLANNWRTVKICIILYLIKPSRSCYSNSSGCSGGGGSSSSSKTVSTYIPV